MSMSYTASDSHSFTVTHARHLSAKVKTDLMRLHRLYPGHLTIERIDEFEAELTEMLRHGYVKVVTYGFKRNGQWIAPTLRYTAQEMAYGGIDDDPGRVPPGADISNAAFGSFMEYSSAWFQLTEPERTAFQTTLPFSRVAMDPPSVNGYFADDKTYSSGGRSLGRSSVRSFA